MSDVAVSRTPLHIGDHGRRDPIVPPFHAELIAERVPDAILAVVPGGHIALIESRDDVLSAILSWLDFE